MQRRLAPALLVAVAALAACGGGGGNPGDCQAPQPTCEAGGNPNFVAPTNGSNGVTTSTPSTTDSTGLGDTSSKPTN